MKRKTFIVLIFLFTFNIYSISNELSQFAPAVKELGQVRYLHTPEHYNQDNLWNYIDGGAPGYISYGFKELLTFSLINQDSIEIIVDIFSMGDTLNAFGIYSLEKSPTGQHISLGNEGFKSAYTLNFWQDKYYVKLTAFKSSQQVSDFLSFIAEKISGKMPGKGALPRMFKVFPDSGRISGSERFILNDVLGLEFLHNGYSAEYELDGKYIHLYLIKSRTIDISRKNFERFITYKKETGELWTDIANLGEAAFTGTDNYYGPITFACTGKYIVGVLGEIDDKMARQILSQFITKIEN